LTFTESGEQFICEAIDIDNDVFLIVKDEDNQMSRLISADIDI
ncbi:biotin--[acetyl-CoA-carboxylase] ligase, partial [Staphylococcus epidermidis]